MTFKRNFLLFLCLSLLHQYCNSQNIDYLEQNLSSIEGVFRVCELDQDSLLDGVCNYYYSTDSLIVATGRYVKGKKEGLFLEFDKKGRVYYSTYYLNDSVVLSFSYYLGGKLFKIVSSMNGKEKDFFMFRRFGNRINLQRRKHKNGVIHEIYFKRNGNISLEDRFPN